MRPDPPGDLLIELEPGHDPFAKARCALWTHQDSFDDLLNPLRTHQDSLLDLGSASWTRHDSPGEL